MDARARPNSKARPKPSLPQPAAAAKRKRTSSGPSVSSFLALDASELESLLEQALPDSPAVTRSVLHRVTLRQALCLMNEKASASIAKMKTRFSARRSPRKSPSPSPRPAQSRKKRDFSQRDLVAATLSMPLAAQKGKDGQRKRRQAIAALYTLLGEPDESTWDEPVTGAMDQISVRLGMTTDDGNPRDGDKTIRAVLEKVVAANDPKYDAGERKTSLRPANVKLNIVEHKIAVAEVVSGAGYRQALHTVNAYRELQGREQVGFSSVYAATKRMQTVCKKRGSKKAGTKDKTSKWARARLEQANQMHEQLAMGEDGQGQTQHMVEQGWKGMKLEQIAFCDEKHSKTVSGCSSKWEHRAPVDPETGEHLPIEEGGQLPEPKPVTNNKYEKEARVLAGVMMKKGADGEHTGHKMPLYSYTGMLMVGPAKFEKCVQAKIKWADTTKGAGWGENPGKKTTQFAEFKSEGRDVPGVRKVPDGDELKGEGRGGRWEARFGAKLVPHPLWSEQLPIAKAPMVPRWRAEVVKALSKGADAKVCFHTIRCAFGSLFASLYALCINDLVSMMRLLTTHHSPLITQVDVRDSMDHLVCGMDILFAGTPYADTWIIAHDALSQWWEVGALDHLKELGFGKDRMLSCKGDTAKWEARYKDKLVGNSPELMPLDSNLFSDFEYGMRQHIALTSILPNENPFKMGKGTPDELLNTMKKTWEVTPTSARIVEDIKRWPTALLAIIEAEGAVVAFLDNRKGRRKMSPRFVPHPDCRVALKMKMEQIEKWEKEEDPDWLLEELDTGCCEDFSDDEEDDDVELSDSDEER